jgi:hypothetical protein
LANLKKINGYSFERQFFKHYTKLMPLISADCVAELQTHLQDMEAQLTAQLKSN